MSQNKAVIDIAPDGDIFFEVTEYNYDVEPVDNERPIKHVVWFKVSQKALEDGAQHFKALIGWHFRGSTDNTVKLDDETILSSELWLRQIHSTMIDKMYDIPIEEVWHAIAMGRKRFLENEQLNPWFSKWLARKGGNKLKNFELEELKMLMYPCEEFEHVRGFAAVTQRLAYEWAGHIQEENPLIRYGDFRHLRLDHRVLAALNDARTGLKSKIHNPIWAATEPFMKYPCNCKEKAHYEISKSLWNTRIWPLEKHFYGQNRVSVDKILDALERFEYTPPSSSCPRCSIDFKRIVVNPTIHSVRFGRSCFQGLCLDCILRPARLSRDEEFIYRKEINMGWDMGCSIPHGEPTWWYSSLAHSKEPDAHRRERDEKRRKKRGLQAI